MSKEKVFAATEAYLRNKNENIIVFTLDDEKLKLEGFGDDVWVKTLQDNPDLMDKLQEVFANAANAANDGTKLVKDRFPRLLPKLFACPGSKAWKGVDIRKQLTRYLDFFGYGHNKSKKYGEGQPPPGWPVVLDWSGFKGPSKGYSFAMCTQVIEHMLLHQGLDPLVHFIDKIEEDNDDDETKEKEFEDVPGPSKKRKRVEKTNTKQSIVNMIKTIQDREDQENAVLARQRANKRALQIFMEEGELEDSD